MGEQTSGASEESSQVDRLIAEYLSRVDAGDKLTQAQFISEHAEFAPQLRQYFADVSMVNNLPKGTTPGTATTEEPKDDQTVANTVVRGTSDSETSVTRDGDFDIDIPDSSETSIEIPETFGRYRIVKVLGQGAMGAVYLARDTQLDRDVALKIPKFSDVKNVDREEMLARFYREARAAATLRSPNICPVYDVGEIDGQHYITMAYINGRPLRDFTKSDKTHSEKQIATTIRKLALALAEAHEIGVIHRDLKPANIMVDRKAEPVVMDFGLARRNSSDDVQVTQSGAIVGTPAYMAPEQVAGEQTGVGPQVDIYALGVIMYELITGQMPFKGNLMSILQQIALNNPKKPSELRREIDSRLEKICLKMMAGDPKQRYQTMEDVAADLQDYLRNPQKKIKTAVVTPIAANKTSLPTASQESNPALISIEQPKSYAEQLREKKSRSSTNRSSLNLPEVASAGWNTPRNLLIAGGGVLSLCVMLGVVFLVRLGKYDVEITLEDPSIKLSIDGDALVIEDGQGVKRLSAGEHKLKLEAGSIIAEVDDFTVTKDGKTALLAKLVNQDLQVFRNGKKIYPSQTNSGAAISKKNPNVYLKEGLMGHWRFEEASGTRILDSSGKQNHGVVEGDATWVLDSAPSPLAGKRSMRFDQGNVLIPVSRSLSVQNELAIAFWCKLDANAEGRYFINSGEIWGVRSAGDSVQFEYLLEGKETKDLLWPPTKPENFMGGYWNHCVINCMGEKAEIWINGRRRETKALAGTIQDPVSDFILGYEISGSMDDFRFYNRPLNESEIAVLANVVDRTGFLGRADATGENDLQLGFGDESMPALNPSDVDSPEWGLYFDSQSDEVNFPSLEDKVGAVTIELWMQFAPDHHEAHSIIAGFGPLTRIGTSASRSLVFSIPGTEGAAAPKVSWEQYGVGQPVHVAGIRDFQQHQVRLYINGKLIAIESVPPQKGEDFFQLVSSKHQWQSSDENTDHSFHGWIDEVRVSQGAKYSADFTPQRRLAQEPDTLALYHFDEGQGTVLKDTSGNGHDGEIVGATWVKGAVVP